MDSFEKLQFIIASCKNSVELTVNNHRDIYQSVQEYITHGIVLWHTINEDAIDSDKLAKMKLLNIIIELQFYPHNSIVSYTIYHYDLSIAIDEAYQLLLKEMSNNC